MTDNYFYGPDYLKRLDEQQKLERDRNAARSKTPFRQPEPQPIVLRRDGLEIQFAPEFSADEADKQRKEALIIKVRDLLRDTIWGAELLSLLAELKQIRKIFVLFADDFPRTNETDAATAGNFDPAMPVSQYKAWVKYALPETALTREETESGAKMLFESGARKGPAPKMKWPDAACRTFDFNITYNHKEAESRMAVTSFHELLHIWFVNKYWNYFQQRGNTGHGDVSRCVFDVVEELNPATNKLELVAPFHFKLQRFYAEIDRKEAERARLKP